MCEGQFKKKTKENKQDHKSRVFHPPPRGFLPTLRHLGPGLIVSGAIVGSGELIATTTLGARVGFAALWLIILSCLIKVVIQGELARHTIISGETSFAALDRIPGPRWRTSWVVWCWMIMFVAVTFQQGGILGGVAQVFHLTFPQLSVPVWGVITSVGTILLLQRGRYSFVERSCTLMVVSFTFITLACAVLLLWTPYAPRWEELTGGFRLGMPPGGLAVAFAVFGITGVGATELIYYPYWCLEKGYAHFVGPSDHSAGWLEGARGWIRVMRFDTLVAMVLYTLATLAFYTLGASVLHRSGQLPAGYDMIKTLSHMYTTTLGPWAYGLFLLGAFIVLFSTIFSGMASNSRVLVDFLDLIRIIRIGSTEERWGWHRRAVVTLVLIYTFWFLLVGQPVFMVIIGGIAQASMLPIIGFSTIYLRYKHSKPGLTPSFLTDVLLWVCSTLMLGFALYTLSIRLLTS